MFPKNADISVVKETLRLSEKLLDAQLSIVSALSQRAGALAGVLGAGATAMLAAEILLLSALKHEINISSYMLLLLAPMLMFIGCVHCGLAAGTSTFQTAGNYPSAWVGNVTEQDLKEALIGELENYQTYINRNDSIIKNHARLLRQGLRYGFFSPVVLAAIGLVFFATRTP